MPHQWTQGNLPVNAKCVVCDRTCGSVRRPQDYYCLWCQVAVSYKLTVIYAEIIAQTTKFSDTKLNDDGAAVRRRTRDRLPAGALSSQLGQLSLPSLRGR